MDKISFRDVKDPEVGVLITINGRNLMAIVRDVEEPFARRERNPDRAGAYTYFGPAISFLPSRHFLGEPVHSFTDGEGRIFVLACTCGIPQCWALSTRIQVTGTEIIWSEFRQIHRYAAGINRPPPWKYDKLGPFVFNRRLYERELLQSGPK